jgi:hypothetical protein
MAAAVRHQRQELSGAQEAMSDRTCYLHVGTGKTGSSAIQYALTKAHDALLRQGYLYPDAANNFRKVLAGGVTAGNALSIAKLLRKEAVERAIELVKPYAEFQHHLVLSCEGFSNYRAPVLAQFGSQLRSLGYETRALVFFRPQAEVVVSSYLQQVKTNKVRATLSLGDYVAQEFTPEKLDRWNWAARARKLEGAFGKGNVTVKWYPSARRVGLDGVAKAAFAWLGLPTLYEDARISAGPIVVNPTPGLEAFLVLRAVNSSGFGGKSFAGKFLSRAQLGGLLGSRIALNNLLLQKVHAATRKYNVELIECYCPELSASAELELPGTVESEPAVNRKILHELVTIASDVLMRKTGVQREFVTAMFKDLTDSPETQHLDRADDQEISARHRTTRVI